MLGITKPVTASVLTLQGFRGTNYFMMIRSRMSYGMPFGRSKRKSMIRAGHPSFGFRFQYCASLKDENRHGDSTFGEPSTEKMKPSPGYINLEMPSGRFPDSVTWLESAKSNRQDIWKPCLISSLERRLSPTNATFSPHLALT